MYLSTAMTTVLLLTIFLSTTTTGADSPPPSPQQSPSLAPSPKSLPTNCSDRLVAFSMCLPYISEWPNNISDSPSRQCCNDVSSAFTSGTAVCLCYFFQKPLIFGFPLNSTRLFSLTSLCPMNIDRGTKANFSLPALCSGPLSLPPLLSVNGLGQAIQNTSRNPGTENPPPPTSLTQEETDDSGPPAPADDSNAQAIIDTFDPEAYTPATGDMRSFATKGINSKCHWFLSRIMILVVYRSINW